MKAEFTDAEILELTAMIGDWLAFGRLNAVLDIAEACAVDPEAPSDGPPRHPGRRGQRVPAGLDAVARARGRGRRALATYVGGKGIKFPWRAREAARMRIAQINGCNDVHGVGASRRWRSHGVDEELYAHVEDPAAGDYSEQELLAIEYAEKFALDHRSLDDAFFARMKAEFTDAEILELTACIGDWIAFGRMTAVLDLDEACAWSPPASAP